MNEDQSSRTFFIHTIFRTHVNYTTNCMSRAWVVKTEVFLQISKPHHTVFPHTFIMWLKSFSALSLLMASLWKVFRVEMAWRLQLTKIIWLSVLVCGPRIIPRTEYNSCIDILIVWSEQQRHESKSLRLTGDALLFEILKFVVSFPNLKVLSNTSGSKNRSILSFEIWTFWQRYLMAF